MSDDKYFCKVCNFNTNNEKKYEKHLLTLKHNKLTNSCKECMKLKIELKNTQDKLYEICKKYDQDTSKLWKKLHNMKEQLFRQMDKNMDLQAECGKTIVYKQYVTKDKYGNQIATDPELAYEGYDYNPMESMKNHIPNDDYIY